VQTDFLKSLSNNVGTMALMVLAVLLACSCNSGENTMNTATQSDQLLEIESYTGLKFPQDSKLIYYEREMESDALIRAKFSFTPSQWQTFSKQLPMDPDTFEDEQRYLLGANSSNWNPQDTKQLPTSQALLPDGQVLDVGVDRTNPERFVVFLVWHRT
jgi:hypothetical protein